MFGFKIVRKSVLLNLKKELEDTKVILFEKCAVISSLKKEINELKNESKKETEPKESSSKTVLLTDVAESNLKVEKTTKKNAVKKICPEN